MDTKIFLTVEDESGELRPMANIWRDNEQGRISAEGYAKKNPDIKIARIEVEVLGYYSLN